MNSDILNHIDKGRVFAIIPARSGSKGIKDKNIRVLNGHPLIAYTIAVAKLAAKIDRVIVSTDSEKYAEIARQYGAETPFLRPKEISGDKATDIEFMQHAVNWFFENEGSVPEYWVHLRVTTPCRKPSIIDDSIKAILDDKRATALLSLNSPKDILTPFKWLKIGKNGYAETLFWGDKIDLANAPRQSFETAYIRTDYTDVLKTSTILSDSLYGRRVLAFNTPYTGDIDDEISFNNCAELLKNIEFGEIRNYLNR